ncbi:MAG TPA: 16S rRNA (uracil(1498)-N(3))-methyltransferase [Opitutaceae bacterium]|nr:16S rRNA (uracil(1498)-N(3))-methyltransferase [Opitutaceae bacterium]
MPDFRAFCQPATAEPTEITLSSDESHHLIVVNRAKLGDTVVAFDGRGHEWICELTGDRRSGAMLKVRFKQAIKPLTYEITLGQALPKGPGMESIVRKATEIGVARIVPLESERTQVHLDEERSDKKTEKWQTAALEAAKQCGNAFLPDVQPVENASAFIENAKGYDLKLIASLQPGAKSLKTVLANFRNANAGRAPRKVVWLVGPEGDFTPAELSLSKSAGFEPITLGPLVLRCETAAVYALSILSYELQNA